MLYRMNFLLYLVFLVFLVLVLSACSSSRTTVIDTPETLDRQKPYEYKGKRYEPLPAAELFVQEGQASWYGKDFHGKPTSNGETFDMYGMTAAHKTLPLGVFVKTQNKKNGKEVVVRINDRGPFAKDRIIDLSFSAAKELGIIEAGIAPVRVEALGFPEKEVETRDQRGQEHLGGGPFAIQIAAFKSSSSARRLAEKMEKQLGYSRVQESVVKGNRYFRVQAGRYDSFKMAEKARAKLEAQGYADTAVVALK